MTPPPNTTHAPAAVVLGEQAVGVARAWPWAVEPWAVEPFRYREVYCV
jgi:hypothetical protein